MQHMEQTHNYGFQLITILVIDEYGEGFPAGWCISNKEDHILLTNFYRHIRKNVGIILPTWFMSDDAEQHHSAWVSEFGGNPHKLLCTWHVDRAWRKSLPKVTDKESQIEIYHTLRVLLEEKDIDKFNRLLQNAVLKWGQDPLQPILVNILQPTIRNGASNGLCATERKQVLTQTCTWSLSTAS